MFDRKERGWFLENTQAKDDPRAMSVGIATAMVRAVCKHQSIPTQVDAEEAMEQFVFLPSFYEL